MPLTDTTIENWNADYRGADDNTPLDGQLIATQLDDEVRNIMSVVRAESENKNWQRHGLQPTYLNSSAITQTANISFVNDQTSVAQIGRRMRMYITGGIRYGTVINSSYSAPNTTVQVRLDPQKYTGTFTVPTSDSISLGGGGSIASFPLGAACIIWGNADNSRKVRFVRNTSGTTVNFESNTTGSLSTCFPPIGNLDHDLQIPSMIDASLSRVDFGPFTPGLYKSGWPHSVIGGVFNVTLNGTPGPFSTLFPPDASGAAPILTHDTAYTVQIQAGPVVSGSPTSSQWTTVSVTTKTTNGFSITLAGSPTGATVSYFYYISRET